MKCNYYALFLFAFLCGCGSSDSGNMLSTPTGFRLSEKVEKVGDDGKITRYNADGEVETVHSFIGDIDKSDIDFKIIKELSYDDDGNITYQYENFGLGTEQTIKYYYNDGNLVSRELIYNESGEVRKTITTYNYEGGKISFQGDDVEEGNKVIDGVFDSTITYLYSSNLLEYENHDKDGDGDIDWLVSYYYINSKLVKESYDTNNDGVIESLLEYGAEGNLSKISNDYDSDGSFDDTTTYTSFVDVNGILNEVEILEDVRGNKIITTKKSKYDMVISISSDFNGDGLDDFIRESTYDDYGNILTFSIDSNGDGVPESVKKHNYVYDSFNNILVESISEDTMINTVIEYTWVAVGS